MSLAKRNNGCLECRTRRVICDKTEPECFKCRKKGIKCSGQGIECRFSPYMRKKSNAVQAKATAAAVKSSNSPPPAESSASNKARPTTSTQTPTPSPVEATASLSKQFRWVDHDSASAPSPSPKVKHATALVVPKFEDELESSALHDTPVHWSSASPASSNSSHSDDSYDPDTKGKVPLSPAEVPPSQSSLVVRRSSVNSRPWPYERGPTPTIQTISSDSRFFFDHFSNFIASKMVVLDFNDNGYRQIVLPLAVQDPMVSQAISVVSAFHLAQVVPSLRMKAEVNQQRVLSKLRENALLPNRDQFFKLSTWVTILVLLVGDTITGSTNYVYLLDLLSHLSHAALSDNSIPENVKQFIAQQTQMFMLFGSPLSSPQKGLEIMLRRPPNYLSFMEYCPCTPEQRPNIAIFSEVIRQACDIFQSRASNSVTPESSIASVERMRQTVKDMDPNADGSHALVWPFFIAAAESSLQEHRDFFSGRLKGLFSCTRFGSIPVALDTLTYIWSKSETTSWTDIVTRERQVLIM